MARGAGRGKNTTSPTGNLGGQDKNTIHPAEKFSEGRLGKETIYPAGPNLHERLSGPRCAFWTARGSTPEKIADITRHM
eukprot:1111725-Pyramimonas_sp.AAC.1